MTSIDVSNFIGMASFANGPGGPNAPRGGGSGGNSWYEAMSRAWGNTLDAQAAKVTELSDQISAGGDNPSSMVQLTAASLKMQFMSNNAATSQNGVAQALQELSKR